MQINGKRAFQEKHEFNGKVIGGNIYCFFWQPRRNDVLSKASNVPVYDRALMVEIRSPGFKHQMHVAEIEIRHANGQVRERNSGDREPESGREITWREKLRPFLEAWEKETATPDDGTPLEEWPKLDVAMIATLREARIYSVEMLAALPDNRLDAVPLGGRVLRDQAQAFIDAKHGNSKTDALIARNNDLEERVKLLEAQINAVRLADAEKGEEPARRGRPPKQVA